MWNEFTSQITSQINDLVYGVDVLGTLAAGVAGGVVLSCVAFLLAFGL